MIITISKEQYQEIKKSNCIEDKAFELGLISESDKCGYGIKSIKIYEKDQEHYLEYTTYDSCD